MIVGISTLVGLILAIILYFVMPDISAENPEATVFVIMSGIGG